MRFSMVFLLFKKLEQSQTGPGMVGDLYFQNRDETKKIFSFSWYFVKIPFQSRPEQPHMGSYELHRGLFRGGHVSLFGRGCCLANFSRPDQPRSSLLDPVRHKKNCDFLWCFCVLRGSNRLEQARTGSSRLEQARTGSNRLEQARTGPNRLEQGRTGSNRAYQTLMR
jgi:hypothetical protein